MAYDKVVDSAKLDADLKSVADAIKAKSGTTGKLEFPDGYISDVGTLVNAEDYLAAVLNKEVVEIVNSKVTSIPSGFQTSNQNLKRVILPAATIANDDAFANCYYLEEADFSSVTSIGAQFITSNGKLTELYMPSLTTMTSWGYTFNVCQALKKVVFPVFTGTITGASFNSCKSLETLVLGADTVCTLSSTDVFSGTPIASGTGYIYVKRALVDSFKAKTNWNVFQFRAIEDYPDICGE